MTTSYVASFKARGFDMPKVSCRRQRSAAARWALQREGLLQRVSNIKWSMSSVIYPYSQMRTCLQPSNEVIARRSHGLGTWLELVLLTPIMYIFTFNGLMEVRVQIVTLWLTVYWTRHSCESYHLGWIYNFYDKYYRDIGPNRFEGGRISVRAGWMRFRERQL